MVSILIEFFKVVIISNLRLAWNKFKIKLARDEVKQKKEELREPVKKANQSYDDFLNEYSEYLRKRDERSK